MHKEGYLGVAYLLYNGYLVKCISYTLRAYHKISKIVNMYRVYWEK